MKVSIIIASINKLENIAAFKSTLTSHDCKVTVIDEGEEKVRRKNEVLLKDVPHEYYGPRERKEWFKRRFGAKYKPYLSVIPERCHAETSFGLLIAYEEKPDMVIELDDDVFPFSDHIIDGHARNLFGTNGTTVFSKGKWYNTLENLCLNGNYKIFPRGHPYAKDTRNEDYIWTNHRGKCILNMGLWARNPDLDALTILYHGGLNGLCNVESVKCKRQKIILGEGTYFALCSMNTAFLAEIIPAFYQLYTNVNGIERFDDIWSGIFFKRIADHLKKKICIGVPLVSHNRRPRNTFNDLKRELEGMIINERLWRIVDKIELTGTTYWEAYHSLIQALQREVSKAFYEKAHRNLLELQLRKMELWLKILDFLT
jgi:hypothetical protein